LRFRSDVGGFTPTEDDGGVAAAADADDEPNAGTVRGTHGEDAAVAAAEEEEEEKEEEEEIEESEEESEDAVDVIGRGVHAVVSMLEREPRPRGRPPRPRPLPLTRPRPLPRPRPRRDPSSPLLEPPTELGSDTAGTGTLHSMNTSEGGPIRRWERRVRRFSSWSRCMSLASLL
jgi:hypothetical protein